MPPDANSRGSRSFDPDGAATILALVPFGADYEAEHWKQLRDNLAAAAASLRDSDADSDDPDDETVRIVRTLDLDSPRVVSTQLHEAMRLTDFCLVDLTTARPNVVYELGVRLAVNPLHPVVVCDPDLDHPFAGQPWAAAARYQCDQLCSLLAAMRYRPYDGPIGQYGAMVQRHLTLRELEVRPNDPRRRSRSSTGSRPAESTTWRGGTRWSTTRSSPSRWTSAWPPPPTSCWSTSNGAAVILFTRVGIRSVRKPTAQAVSTCWRRGCTCTSGGETARRRTSSNGTRP